MPPCPQISLSTRDVFIECTATDLTKAKVVLNTVVTMFSQYTATPFEIEPVQIIDSFGQSHGKREALYLTVFGLSFALWCTFKGFHTSAGGC